MLTREQIVNLLDTMIIHQHQKLLARARELVPGVTEEDIRNPQDFEVLEKDSRYQYEDGILTGYRSAQIALIAELNRQKK